MTGEFYNPVLRRIWLMIRKLEGFTWGKILNYAGKNKKTVKSFCFSRKSNIFAPSKYQAGVAKLVDALDLGSSAARPGGSSPFART